MRRHSRAIPQYVKGHGKILSGIREALSPYPSLHFAGNYVGGISMPKTVAYAISILDEK